MATTLDTLQQRPEDLAAAALPALIDPASGVALSDLTLSTLQRGQTLLVPTTEAYAKSGWAYYGHAVATYQPLDMAEVFGTYELRLVVAGPCNTTDLAAQLAAIFGVNLRADDVVAAAISTITPGMTVMLTANPNSLMWVGQRAVRLYTQTVPYQDVVA